MKSISNIVAGMIFLLSFSCAFNDDPSKTIENDKQRRERDYLNKVYSIVQGAYSGRMISSQDQKEYKVQLGLYTQDERVGVDSNGEPIMRPVLYGHLEFETLPELDTTLNGKFYPETGELILAAVKSSSAEIQSLDLHLKSSTLTGPLRSTPGEIGTLDLTKTASTYTVPGEASVYERYQRIRALYRAVEGEYKGIIHITHKSNPVEKDFPAVVTITLRDVVAPDGLLRPSLTAFYIWDPSVDPLGGTSATLNVLYRPDRTPPELTMASVPTPSGYQVSLSTVFEKDQIRGEYLNQRGSRGTFVMKRKR